jgi:glycosyltransferase involved in cell wall biosynthesis
VNILHVYKDYYPVLGGIENHIRVLAEAQARHGHQVTVLTTHAGRGIVAGELGGVRVIKAGRFATVASTPLSLSLLGALRRQKPDLTHLHAPYPPGELTQYLFGRGRPYVMTYHADATRRVQRAIMSAYGPLFRRVLRRAARVIATSPTYAASSPYLRHAADRTVIAPLGVDVERFRPAARMKDRPPTLLFVGQLRHYKGLDDLLQAMTGLPQARLLVAGDGPMRTKWEARGRSSDLKGRVNFLGKVDDADLPAVYRSADVFVLPANSRAEAFGTVLLEAMASGLPCVTTEVGSGTSYVVQDGLTGIVVPPRDPEALATALQPLLADRVLRARLGAAGRLRVLEHFSVERMIADVDAVYQSALGR